MLPFATTLSGHIAEPSTASPVEIRGALDLEVTDAGIRPRRLPAWTRAQYPDQGMDDVAAQPSGVRLAFRTRATTLELGVLTSSNCLAGEQPLPALFDLVLDEQFTVRLTAPRGTVTYVDPDKLIESREPGSPGRITFADLPSDLKEVEIWLPQHTSVELTGLWSDAEILPPTPADRPRWLHHGSSISHCFEADGPTGTWPAVAAALGHVDLLNLALAGNAMLDPYTARAIRDQPADLISIKLGINIVNAAAMRLRTFGPAVHGFLDMIRDGHPDTPLLLISPIICPIVEDTPGPTGIPPGDESGRFVAYGDPADVAQGALTLQVIRELLAEIAATRAESDPNLHYLDGRELFGERDLHHLPDALHPDAIGYRRMGARFAEIAFAPGGIFEKSRT